MRNMVETELRVAHAFVKTITVMVSIVVVVAVLCLVCDYVTAMAGARWVLHDVQTGIFNIEKYPLARWGSLLFVYSAPMLTASAMALVFVNYETRRYLSSGRSVRTFGITLLITVASMLAFFGSVVAVVALQTLYH
jgi:hypothetical protein